MNASRSLALRVSTVCVHNQYAMPKSSMAMKITGMIQLAATMNWKLHCRKWPIPKKKLVMIWHLLWSVKDNDRERLPGHPSSQPC